MKHEVQFLMVGICISEKKLFYGSRLCIFQLNTEINFTTQDSQGVYVLDVSMTFYNYLFAVV